MLSFLEDDLRVDFSAAREMEYKIDFEVRKTWEKNKSFALFKGGAG
jgi:hypothetical protein